MIKQKFKLFALAGAASAAGALGVSSFEFSFKLTLLVFAIIAAITIITSVGLFLLEDE